MSSLRLSPVRSSNINIYCMSYKPLGSPQAFFRPSNLKNDSDSDRQLLDSQLTLEEKFNQALVQTQQLLDNDEIQEGINKIRLIMEKINLMKQSKKEYDKKLEMVCIYNLAAAYQKQWSLDECIPLLQKFISMVKAGLQETLKSSGNLNNGNEGPVNKHWFKLKTALIRGMLQYCAVMSQIGQHKQALKTAIEITGELKMLFCKGFEQIEKQISKKQSMMARKGTKRQGKPGADKIEFSFSVLLSARQSLRELVKMQAYNEITDSNETQEAMQEVKSNIYFWQNVPQNNIKTLRQSFNTSKNETNSDNETTQEIKKKNQRNLLGVKRNQDWIEEFTIAKVMFMTPINYLEFTDYDNLIFEFNHRNLVEKIFLLSVSYFSLSIQLRFLEQETAPQKKKNINSEDNKPEILKSQILHLKSIQVVCKHIKENSAFVNHLVFNYHKHYKNNLNIIHEENSMAQDSELYHKKENTTDEPVKEENCIGNFILPSSKAYRKDSIYYEEQVVILKQKEDIKKDDDPVIAFKKPKKKEVSQDDRTQKITNLGSSTSFSRGQDIQRKDKTLKKIGSCKIMALSKKALLQLEKNEKNEKQISSRQLSSRSIKEKSLSQRKNFLKNSANLKQKNSSPAKQRRSKQKGVNDLRESGDLRRDFGKKKSPSHCKALDLLKRSGSLNQFSGKNLKDSGNIYTSPSSLQLKKKR